MITLKHEGVETIINLPTSVNEITGEVLTRMFSRLSLPKGYAVIALAFKVDFSEVLIVNKKAQPSIVYPLFVTANVDETNKYNGLPPHCEAGRTIIIDKTAIERGVHIHIPTVANEFNIRKYFLDIEKLTNPTARNVTKESIMNSPKDTFFLLEAKIVPCNAISGVIDETVPFDDPFNGFVEDKDTDNNKE